MVRLTPDNGRAMNGNSNGNAVIASDLRKLFKMKKYVKIFQNEKVAFEMNKGLSLSHKYSTMQPVYFLPFSLLIILIMTLIGIRKSPKFPKIHSVNVLFRERFLSGKSSGIMRTYQNALEVVLTEQELWIRPFFLLFPFAALFNQIHRIPLSAIQAIETKGGETTVRFLNAQGKEVYFTFSFNKRALSI